MSVSLQSKNFRSKEESWLSFNSRVLQEAADPTVPILDRLKFLGIYSSNLDEFFRVRVATLKRLIALGPKHYLQLKVPNPEMVLRNVNQILTKEKEIFNKVYWKAMKDLDKKHDISVVSETEVPKELEDHLEQYFLSEVRPRLMPIIIKGASQLQGLKDYPMYLAVVMTKKKGGRPAHAILEIPNELPRFVVLPSHEGKRIVMYIDDVIRFGLKTIFRALPYDDFQGYAIKFTRDAELEFDDDVTESFYEKIAEGLKARDVGNPVRLNYDKTIPPRFLKLLTEKLNLSGADTLFPGARYHNRKDLMGFPFSGEEGLSAQPIAPVPHHGLSGKRNVFAVIREKDRLLHFPYHSFGLFLHLLREASMDPLVQEIKISQYRLASKSAVGRALVNAVRNGKDVTVVVEPRARFDEKNNIHWANEYQEAGVKVQLGVPGLKVHSKMCLISRKERGKIRYYSCLGTGNFNESTAALYTDHLLLTANNPIGRDVESCFKFLNRSYCVPKLKHLIAAPFNLRDQLGRWIDREIANKKKGKKAGIFIKLNNFSDPEVVQMLVKASQAGVRVRMIVRSMFSIVTEQSGVTDHIEAIGIVDNYLEHSRIFIFENAGKPETYLCSADFLPRNFDSRFETAFPIYDKSLQKELATYMDFQWRDNVKARKLDRKLTNPYRRGEKGEERIRAQASIREFLEKLAKE